MTEAVEAEKAAQSARAKGRWKLLQRALLSSHNTTTMDAADHCDAHSLRRFPGYQMLPSRTYSSNGGEDDAGIIEELRNQLCQIVVSNNSNKGDEPPETLFWRDVETSMLALQALLDHAAADPLELCVHHHPDPRPFLEAAPPRLRDRCFLTPPPEEEDTSGCCWRLVYTPAAEEAAQPSPPQYCIREYQLFDNRNLRLLTRERRPTSQLSLAELVSHHGGVDNTGNICVWDCAQTLAWALLQEKEQESLLSSATTGGGRTILELGAGMAALSALTLAVHSQQHPNSSAASPSSCTTKIYITDGHADCVQNNRVNVRLLRAAGRLPTTTTIDCRQLRWTTSDDSDSTKTDPEDDDSSPTRLRANTTLVADCTHFEEHHAALLWTVVRHTVVGGRIWLCQPERGRSLARFLALIEAVNENNNCSSDIAVDSSSSVRPLLRVTERRYAALDAKHAEFLASADNSYNPNVHRPRVLVLIKEREATEQDRQCAIRHCRER